MRSVLIIDEVAPKPYDGETLYSTSQGGTESTVTRIVNGLAEAGWGCAVEQRCRTVDDGRYWAAGWSSTWVPDSVVCLRDPNSLYKARERFPEAKLYLWCHDLFSKESAEATDKATLATDAELILVSDYHKLQARNVWPTASGPTMRFIYNPIDPIVDIIRDYDSPLREPLYDAHKLVWFSSPHKGLKKALEIFAEIQKKDSRFTLHVHNPGYMADYSATIPPGVIIKPKGSYVDTLRSVANSLCVFYPNVVFPETFGLVFAEADALGVPVLTHRFGAASEVCDHPSEVMDCGNIEKVIKRVFEWSEGARPLVKARPEFSLSRVLKSWEKLLNE